MQYFTFEVILLTHTKFVAKNNNFERTKIVIKSLTTYFGLHANFWPTNLRCLYNQLYLSKTF